MSHDASHFINRELSWLGFNQRVLDEALEPSVPILERLKFLAITSSNLDEFFMVRVGGLLQMVDAKSTKVDPSGMTAAEQLSAISSRTHEMAALQYQTFLETLEPRLESIGIVRRSGDELDERQRRWLDATFESQISAVISPIGIDLTKPFPLLTNRALYIAVQVREADTGELRRALICCTTTLSRFLLLPTDDGRVQYLLLEDALKLLAAKYFNDEEITEAIPFRITRNADMSVQEDLASDLMEGMADVLSARKAAGCVRLEIAADCSDELVSYLKEALDVSEDFTFRCQGPIDLAAFMYISELGGFDDHRSESWDAVPSLEIDPAASMFDNILERDLLLYHPYETFEPVVRLLNEAADDPNVLAIKQTLYRTSKASPIVAALTRAAENGKHVTVIVELKARFDEERNIAWAKDLEQSSAQVIYGVRGLKTHAKVCIIVRREPSGIRKYIHFGTGNYNEATARIYSDVSYFTCNEELGADATKFFNAITGFTQPPQFRKIDAAPIGLRERIMELIEAETQRVREGQTGRICAKLNSLVDPQIIEALYEASQAGVDVDLNIRGICCLKPGVKGLSEKIRVVSIVDRFLEHARVISFHHGGDPRVLISSADWMPRNLDRRVELLVPIEDASCRDRLLAILETYFNDNVKARELLADGTYRLAETSQEGPFRSQQQLYQRLCDAVKQARHSRPTMFEPHRASGNDE